MEMECVGGPTSTASEVVELGLPRAHYCTPTTTPGGGKSRGLLATNVVHIR